MRKLSGVRNIFCNLKYCGLHGCKHSLKSMLLCTLVLYISFYINHIPLKEVMYIKCYTFSDIFKNICSSKNTI